MLFLYKKNFQKKKFAYLPILKNIETFSETRHLFSVASGITKRTKNLFKNTYKPRWWHCVVISMVEETGVSSRNHQQWQSHYCTATWWCCESNPGRRWGPVPTQVTVFIMFSSTKNIASFFIQWDITRTMLKWAPILPEPPHDKTNKMACAPIEDSDLPGHPPSLISLHCVLNG